MSLARQERYRFRVSLIFKFAVAALIGRRRHMGADVATTLLSARPEPRIINDHHIPNEGPFIFVANHYERPGLKVFWGGMLASYAVCRRRGPEKGLHWLMTSEWYNFRLGPLPVPTRLTSWLFRRIARVYGLVIVPRATGQLLGRAAAMRSILQVVGQENGAIALYPEGTGEGDLIEPQPGTATFLLLLSQRGVPILPAGLYEEEGALTVRFGSPLLLSTPEEEDRDRRDQLVRQQMMVAIGCLLPRLLWGTYARDIQMVLGRDCPSK